VIAAAIAVAAGAIAQAVTGLGFSLVSAPFLIATLGRAEGVRLNLVLSGALNLVLLAGERRQVRWRAAFIVLMPAALATPLLAWTFNRVDGRTLAIVAGVLTVVSAAALSVGVRVRSAGGRLGAAITGVISAGMNVLAGIGGPPVAMYAVNAEWSPDEVRPTLQAYFLGLNAVGIVALGLPHVSLLPWVGLAVGWLAGLVVVRRLPLSIVRPAILLVAAAGGIVAILRARA
jgi:uncharacterized protein